VAKIVDLLGAGEKFSQHHATPGSDGAKVARVGSGLGTGVLPGGANQCGIRNGDASCSSALPIPHSAFRCSFSA
jgi:hypothetical protein